MSNVFRIAFRRLGHAFDTRMVSEIELNQAKLLGDQVARYSYYHATKTRRGYRIV